jgi:hypothetical protein
MYPASIVLGAALTTALLYLLGNVWGTASLVATVGVVVLASWTLDGTVRSAAWMVEAVAGGRPARAVRMLYQAGVLFSLAATAGFVLTRPAALGKASTAIWLVVSLVAATTVAAGLEARRAAAPAMTRARSAGRRLRSFILGGVITALPLGTWFAAHSLAGLGPAPSAALGNAALPAATYCGAAMPEGRPPVVLVGLDGATWTVLRPLMERGDLPTLRRLVERGASGVLEAEISAVNPFANSATVGMRSPTLWETIATGFSPRRHGVWHFEGTVVPWTAEVLPLSLPGFEHVLLNRTDGRLARFYEVAGACDRRVAAVGWYNSWPAAPIDGVAVVSDLAHIELRYKDAAQAGDARARGELSPQDLLALRTSTEHAAVPGDGTVSPPDLVGLCNLSELARDEVGNGAGDAAGSGDEMGRLVAAIERQATAVVTDAAERAAIDGRLLKPLRRSYLRDRFYHRAAMCLARAGRQDLLTVVYRLPDETQHLFWGFWEAGADRGAVAADTPAVRRLTLLADVVPAAYRLMDAYLAELLEALPADRTLLVISDHGFTSWQVHGLSALFPPNAMPDYSGQHTPEGILVADGPGVVPGRIAPAPTHYAIAPTVAWLLGLPAPAGSPEAALVNLFDAAAQAERGPLARTPWPPAPTRLAARSGGPQDDSMREQLRALGYIQ